MERATFRICENKFQSWLNCDWQKSNLFLRSKMRIPPPCPNLLLSKCFIKYPKSGNFTNIKMKSVTENNSGNQSHCQIHENALSWNKVIIIT